MTPAPRPTLASFLSLRFSAGGHPLTRLASQRAGAVLAFAGLWLGLSPSALTLLGLATFLAGAWLYATLDAGIGVALACTVMYQLGYALDCADGQLARATHRTSALGAWLDVACDHVRNIAIAGAALLWLMRSGVSLAAALTACGLMLTATVVHLHTATTLRQSGARPQPIPAGLAGLARSAATTAADTVTVLLCIGLLRVAPAWLLAYAVLLGIGYGLMTWQVARAHLTGTR